MSNPRTPIEELELQGSQNLLRARKRDQQEAEFVATPDVQSEIDNLTELIAQAMKCCRRGQTVDRQPNPAFRNLQALIRARDLLLRGQRKPGKKSAAQLLADVNKALRGVKN